MHTHKHTSLHATGTNVLKQSHNQSQGYSSTKAPFKDYIELHPQPPSPPNAHTHASPPPNQCDTYLHSVRLHTSIHAPRMWVSLLKVAVFTLWLSHGCRVQRSRASFLGTQPGPLTLWTINTTWSLRQVTSPQAHTNTHTHLRTYAHLLQHVCLLITATIH